MRIATRAAIVLAVAPMAAVASAQNLAVFNFNDSVQNTAPDLVVDRAADGVAATLTTNFATGTLNSFTGSTVNAQDGDPAGLDLALQTGEGGVNNGRFLELRLTSTTQVLDLSSLSFAGRRSTSGFNDNTIAYSLNGTDFTNITSNLNLGTTYAASTFDLSGIAALQDVQDVFLRITFSGATVTSATGNNRLDNLVVSGTAAPVPEPASLAAVGLGLAAMARRRRKD